MRAAGRLRLAADRVTDPTYPPIDPSPRPTGHRVRRASQLFLHTAEIALRLPEPSKSRWERAGVSPRTERIFNAGSGLLLLVFTVGWSWSIATANAATEEGGPGVAASIADALTDPNAPSTAYLTAATLEAFTPMRGASGRLRAQIRAGGAPIAGGAAGAGQVADRPDTSLGVSGDSGGHSPVAPKRAGVWKLALKVGSAIKPIADFTVITLRPFTDKRRDRIGLYYLGRWPTEERASSARRLGYANPSGFIEVTPQNQETRVSDHFRLRDFLTHDQEDVWPKYLVLDTKLVDKLELVLSDLAAHGVNVEGTKVMSGFRTPRYNASGGDPVGRSAISRHMYGDAADIFIDNDGDGRMDDLNHDRRVNIRDTRIILEAVERVERANPALVGGCGIYRGTGGHGPFVHIDTRGFRARWIGTGDN